MRMLWLPAETYQIQVLNTGSDAGRPDLTTTISFP